MRRRYGWLGLILLGVAAVILIVRHSAGSVGSLTTDEFGRLAYLAALLLIVGAGVVTSRAFDAGTALRQASIWIALLLGLVLLYSYRMEFAGIAGRVVGELIPAYPVTSTDPLGRQVITLRRASNGHFAVRGTVDGAAATFLIDTGASVLTLSAQTARAAGFDPAALRYTAPVMTANGQAFMAPVTIARLQIGPVELRNLRAYVAPPGTLDDNLLGVNVLDRFGSYEVRGDEMTLRIGG
ncbi:aspartyl protease family protein [Tepidamorphus gemmatus]|uniref:Aspartyl protease family protein n=1 Tax=Tepidamorphus gemmatus TaxID=747076 RepID=A0A4R3MHG8_9HYPH|nr:TIGR02281 family clan AA aspartic protease [Tepidamorphus gemmatus]TCT13475.1 aspartyl protease family protein [Tepidamorphus gemmatus]